MIRWLLAAVGIFIVSFLWHLPATYVAGLAPLPDGLRLQSVQGPWHHGRAWVSWQGRQVGEVTWALQGISSLWGQPRFQVTWKREAAHLNGVIQLQRGRLHWGDVKGVLPLEIVSVLSPNKVSGPLKMAQGRIQVADFGGTLQWGKTWPNQLQGRGQWYGAAVLGEPLPDMAWQMQQKGAPIHLQAQGKAEWGSLQVEGRLMPQDFQLTVTLIAQSGLSPPAGLTAFVRPDGPNRWRQSYHFRP